MNETKRPSTFRLAICVGVLVLEASQAGCGGPSTARTPPRTAYDVELDHAVDGTSAWATDEVGALAEAARTGRLVLLSVQADWCHFCHVMNATTYVDPRVVALLREHFVTVRIDSDARPDLAERYAAWGWPGTIVLDAEGRELVRLRGYRPADELLERLDAVLRDPRPIDAAHPSEPAPTDVDALVDALRTQLDATYDLGAEGWGPGQKYPFTAPIFASWLRAARTGDAESERRADASLARYADLIDPVWGGLYQYSERGDWAHPHYERIAVVEAGAIEAFSAACARGSDRDCAHARDVARFVESFLRTPEGAFATSMDADLRRADGTLVRGAEYAALDDAERRALGLPRVDPSPYASTQGQLAAALFRLAAALSRDDVDRARFTQAALHALDVATERHAVLQGDTLLYTHAPSGDAPTFHLADQVAMLSAWRALEALAARDPAWRDAADARHAHERARQLAASIEAQFCDTSRGCASTPLTIGGAWNHRFPLEENGRFVQSLVALGTRDQDGELVSRAERYLLAVAVPEARARAGRIVGDALLAAELLASSRASAHVVGEASDPRTLALLDALGAMSDARVEVVHEAPGEGAYPSMGEPSVFVCTSTTCSPPWTSPEELGRDVHRLLAE